ncbi:DUF4097 family beta strand repeat-containing protein [Proteinivorax hydrogeniformans]|uniref:DUF4097 family beta strand repeat-containing protein n=1 Tax=Proteinivorax hydrogeniformans TaxID=1826727 RepID=A0AAU8HV38_9FIRM
MGLNEREMILEMLSEGKISQEQANKLLAALDKVEVDESTADGEKVTHTCSKDGGCEEDEGFSLFENLKDAFGVALNSNHIHEFKREIKQTFITSLVDVELGSRKGNIEIQGWSRGYGYIEETIKVKGIKNKEEAEKLAEKYRTLTVGKDFIQAKKEMKSKRIFISYKLFLPKANQYDVCVSTVNGKVTIAGIVTKDCDLSLVNGKCDLSDVKGEDLELSMVNGKGIVSGEFKDIDCSTVNGKLEISDYLSSPGDIDISTVNGPIIIALPTPGLNVKVDLSAVNGRAKVEHPNLNIQSKNGVVITKNCTIVGEGKAHRFYDVSSVNGSLTLKEL